MKMRLLTISETTSNGKEVPLIRLQGRWLENLAFQKGNKILIKEKYGELIIRVANQEKTY